MHTHTVVARVSLRTTPDGLELRPELASLGAVLAPALDLHPQPLAALFPAFFLGRALYY